MDDTISRQEAIDALMPIYKSASLRNRNVFSTARKCMAAIEELPSAQTEIIRCKDCKHYKKSEVSDRMMCWRKDVDGWSVCYNFYPNDFCSYGERRTENGMSDKSIMTYPQVPGITPTVI